MENFNNKIFNYLLPLIFFSCLTFSIYRDIRNLQDGYSCDLRKRIVGARYQAAGLSPYYYKWKPGQPEEFCNPYESGTSFQQNVTTLTPGYLWVLQPLAKVHFSAIEIIWLILQYLFLIVMLGIFLWHIKERKRQFILLSIFCLFLFSKGWIVNVDIGQSYVIFPLLWTIAFFSGNIKIKKYFSAGLVLAICCWLRPVCILMVLPFLISSERLSFLKGFILGGAFCVLQILIFHQYNNWQDFFHSSFQWTEFYNTLNRASLTDFGNGPWPATIEGQSNFNITAIPQYTANLPIVAVTLFNIHLGSTIYMVILLILIAVFLLILYKRKKCLNFSVLWISAFIIYYVSEIFVSIPKQAYYFVELIFPVCLIVYNAGILKQRIVLIITFLGFLLATLITRVIPMQLLIGEYLIFVSILFFLTALLKNKWLSILPE